MNFIFCNENLLKIIFVIVIFIFFLVNIFIVLFVRIREDLKLVPLFVVLDEVTGIIQLDDVPKGVPKDHPMVVEANQANLMRSMILGYLKKIAAELRFAGIRMILSSQVSSVNTGIPTSLRMNLSNKILQGANPTEGNRKLSLTDASAVPYVPENIKTDRLVSKGVGVAELEGQAPVVYKSFFATPTDLVAALDRLHVATTDRPRPTAREIDRFTPSLEVAEESVPKGRSGTAADDYGYAQQSDAEFVHDVDRRAEGGFAKANAARRALDQAAGTAHRKPMEMTRAGPLTVTREPGQNTPIDQSAATQACSSCGTPIDPHTGGCACAR